MLRGIWVKIVGVFLVTCAPSRNVKGTVWQRAAGEAGPAQPGGTAALLGQEAGECRAPGVCAFWFAGLQWAFDVGHAKVLCGH